MARAEERALEAYPEDIQLFVESQEEPGKWLPVDGNAQLRYGYKRGYEQAEKDIKEKMVQEAVEGEVCIPNVWVEHKEGKELVVRAEISKELGFKFGDKVRIIIIKEDKS